MANVTKGSQTSEFPDALPDFTAQSELLDPAAEDTTLAEGRDANKWSAELEAITAAIGIGGRAEVTVAGGTATIESLEYVWRGTTKSYAGETGKSLQAGQVNYIYLNPSTEIVSSSTSGWPSTPHIRLAIWDDSGSPATLTDERPHTLQASEDYPVSSGSAKYIATGTATVLSGNTSIAVSFGVTFSSAPKIVFGSARASDATIRSPNHSNKSVTGFTLHIDTAAPAAGVAVDWIAIGVYASDASGSS